MLTRVQKEFSETVEYLESTLHSLESQPDMEVIVHIDGYEQVIQEMTTLMKQAKNELWLSIWEPQVPYFKRVVDSLLTQNISVFSIVFGAENETLGHTFHQWRAYCPLMRDKITEAYMTAIFAFPDNDFVSMAADGRV